MTTGLATAKLSSENLPVLAVLVGFILFAAVILIILFMLSRALRALRIGAERFASGDLTQAIEVDGPLQVASLGESLNKMAQQLGDRLRTVIEQRNELETVLSSMVEGVVAFDLDERILNFNNAAEQFLGMRVSDVIGRSIHEVIRNPGLQSLVAKVLESDEPVEAELVLTLPAMDPADMGRTTYREHFLQAQGTALRDARGMRVGGLIVLHDVTQMRRLEQVRRDFVGNVSHEIKTPISTIKASVETLIDSGVQVKEEGVPDFLAIIVRQADRLNAIVEDLLSLARLEQEGGVNHVDLVLGSVQSVLRDAVETCSSKARQKEITIELRDLDDLQAHINAPLLEQAIVNLLDNAIKYSSLGCVVELSAELICGQVRISICDHGQGIEPEHLPRLFERFYRTDKARSRAQGGTGLGLSIVKHVCTVHGGHIEVQSKPGEGSTFYITLPMASDSSTDTIHD
ncbi:MAG: PAS domain-containing protein [Phycisphaeraceae bacterium]|nr:PAS domain-containing protein [Phycisphaeraceae bacterium]